MVPQLDLHTLNPQQRDAVLTLSGPLLVLAGAGSGKTRVITYRIVELIRSGISPERILSVTFTNKASREMQKRVMELLGKSVRRKPKVSTFHALCVQILRKEIEVLGYPSQFAILDSGDQQSIAREVLRSIRVQEKMLSPWDLINQISQWKSAEVRPERAAEICEDDKEYLASMAYKKYVDQLRSRGAVDFDDLLGLTAELFKKHPDVLERQQKNFDHVQIDEYQDTNGLQFKLIEALVRPHNNLCVVGDDDQSIYGWRGAEVKHILSFSSHFPAAKVVRMEENYRCTDLILEKANQLVRHNSNRHPKVLRANKKSSNDVRIESFPDETAEAERVILEIDYYSKQQDVPIGDFAILFRTNEQPRIFEAELRRKKIPYVLVGSQSFFDVKEIRDLLAYLKAMAFPKDEHSLLRIINTPARGIGNTSVSKVLAHAVKSKLTFWESLDSEEIQSQLTPKAIGSMKSFKVLMNDTKRKFEQNPRNIPDLIDKFLDQISYRSEIEKLYDTPEQISTRNNMLEEFMETFRDYVKRSAKPTLHEFLEQIAVSGRDDSSEKEEQANQNAVKLMTLHSAKGLEFPRVYMVGMEEGLLPHKRSVEGTENDIAEERRLAYVGVTRAKDFLTMTLASSRKKWGRPRQSVPSRFLKEMTTKVEET